jgi:glycosyltransferase involved in cell wall biosynthesis
MKWALIDPNTTLKDFVLRELSQALQRQGEAVRFIRTSAGSAGELKEPGKIREILKEFMPDRILWCSVAGLPYFELLSEPDWIKTPKICLWFDDPVTRSECIGLSGVMSATANRKDFIHAIWDGYWRDEAFKRWGIRAQTIHLSADEEEYSPGSKPPALLKNSLGKDAVVFIGMLHTEESIARCLDPLPRGLKALASVIQTKLLKIQSGSYLENEKEGLSWDVLSRLGEAELSEKERALIQYESAREPLAVCSFRYGIWAQAKNAVRIRILKQVLDAAPLWVFCEQKQLAHAKENGWRKFLSVTDDRLRIFDTSDLKSEELGGLYHAGALHIQATDPQSVKGGIPLRMFQTAASGRALLTDVKDELLECFTPGKEILAYDSGPGFSESLKQALSNPERLGEIGRAARLRFESQHTWRHRLENISSWLK